MRLLRVHLFIAAMFAAFALFCVSHVGCSDGGEDDDTVTCDSLGCESDECFILSSSGACLECTPCP